MKRALPSQKGPGGRHKQKVTHRDVCRQVASISANLRCGNTEKAKTHTTILLSYLHLLDLLPNGVWDAVAREVLASAFLPPLIEETRPASVRK